MLKLGVVPQRLEVGIVRRPLDELEAIPGPGTLTWRPVRRTLGVRAFGCNAYTAASTGDDVVEPHSE
ncbi:MAG: hypothetical protein M3076_10305 [Actinomycetota bacterium]|nr:hypothetical protein [Actinomycetota bacterium]